MSTVAVEVVYRGIFQKTLARNIVRTIVFAARKEGKIGTAFGRYGDSPERNGIPAKQFAVVADDPEELDETLARYEPTEVDVTINVDDTLCKGVESWAWYGLQPINQLTKPNGTLIVTSRQDADSLIRDMHQKDSPIGLSIVKGTVSFSGLWVYKDDHTLLHGPPPGEFELIGYLRVALTGLNRPDCSQIVGFTSRGHLGFAVHLLLDGL